MAKNNIWIAAADGDEATVLSILKENNSAVNSYDENGYTPLHAAASYDRDALLMKLVKEHGGNVNIRDFDGETPLFVVESLRTAKLLVEDLHADVTITNNDGKTAADTIEADGEYPLIASYLRGILGQSAVVDAHIVPSNMQISMTVTDETAESLPIIDEDFRKRIEDLATREDFVSQDAQEMLRTLVTSAVQQHIITGSEENEGARNVKSRFD